MPAPGIITYGNPFLRKKAEEVAEINDEVRDLIKKLEETLAGENGIGLAAPQIGVSKRVVVVDLTKSKQSKRISLINPRYIYKSLETDEYEEGCLSVPEVWGNVVRPAAIKVKGMLPSGKTILVDADGLYARALQHEIDHLDGKLFIDYLAPGDRDKNKDKIEALLKKNKEDLGKIAL